MRGAFGCIRGVDFRGWSRDGGADGRGGGGRRLGGQAIRLDEAGSKARAYESPIVGALFRTAPSLSYCHSSHLQSVLYIPPGDRLHFSVPPLAQRRRNPANPLHRIDFHVFTYPLGQTPEDCRLWRCPQNSTRSTVCDQPDQSDPYSAASISGIHRRVMRWERSGCTDGEPQLSAGGMFWFRRNVLFGSYLRLMEARRRYLAAPKAWRSRSELAASS